MATVNPEVSEFERTLCGNQNGENKQDTMIDNSELMDMIFQYLDQQSPTSPFHRRPVELKIPSVKRWTNTQEFDLMSVSPVESGLPKYTAEVSLHPSPPSPIPSMLSDSSSFRDSQGPPTPTKTQSYKPQTPSRPAPGPPVDILDRKHQMRDGRNVPRTLPSSLAAGKPELRPKSSFIQPMSATITDLGDYNYMPAFVPSPKLSPNLKRSSLPPVLRISTQFVQSPKPAQIYPQPENRPNPPSLQINQPPRSKGVYRPVPVRKSVPVPAATRELLRDLEDRKMSPKRMSMSMTIPEEVPKVLVVRNPGPSPLSSANSVRKEYPVEKVTSPQISRVREKPLAAAPSGVWFTRGFFAGKKGLQMKMSRRYATFSKMEWVVETSDEFRLLRCFSQTHSLSRRTDFWDDEGTQILQFQRKTGSTRVAEAPNGATLFTVKNASLYNSPYWLVNMGGAPDLPAVQWVSKGDQDLENLVVTWQGIHVGHIAVDLRRRSHTYTINIAPDMNYCIMAALVTVLDDLRTDEGI